MPTLSISDLNHLVKSQIYTEKVWFGYYKLAELLYFSAAK